jgi:hypothetical protein
MTALAWKLNRVRCMSLAEIGHRIVKAAEARIEGWGLARSDVPEPDLAFSPNAWIQADARVDATPYIAASERLAAGVFDIFALEGAQLGSPPQWNRDPRTGIVAPLTFGKLLDYRDPLRVGDCKYLWEPNRHLHLVTFAQAWALTDDPRHAQALRAHLESWLDQCPYPMGPNWSSALEAGLRLVNWALAWQLLGGATAPIFEGEGGRAFRSRWLESVYRHAEFVNGHYSLHSSANNHLIGEAAGVYIASMAWPHWERSDAWHETAKAILEREALLQNAPDGVNREQSTSYQQWTFDLLLLPLLAARANGDDFAPEYAERLESMLEFLYAVTDAGGNVPMLGDADDGFVVRLDPHRGFCRYKSLLATGALLFGRADFAAKAGKLDDKTRWLLGNDAAERLGAMDTSHVPAPRREFPDGGYYVLGCELGTPREIRVVADAGPLGYREIAAHGHADALSFTLSVGGDEFLVDPGTYAYHTQPEWRAYFRGTAAHNTVRIDGQDQSQQGGNFMWLRKANAACSSWASMPDHDVLEASHDGYRALPDPVLHRRRVILDKHRRTLVVEDYLEMDGAHDVEIFLHAAPEAHALPTADGVKLARAGRAIRVVWPDLAAGRSEILRGQTSPVAGWVSRRFDRKEPAATLVWRARLTGDCVLRTVIDCRSDYPHAPDSVTAGQESAATYTNPEVSLERNA